MHDSLLLSVFPIAEIKNEKKTIRKTLIQRQFGNMKKKTKKKQQQQRRVIQ